MRKNELDAAECCTKVRGRRISVIYLGPGMVHVEGIANGEAVSYDQERKCWVDNAGQTYNLVLD